MHVVCYMYEKGLLHKNEWGNGKDYDNCNVAQYSQIYFHGAERSKEKEAKEKKNYLLHATKRTLNFALIQWKSSPRESGGIKLKLYYCHLIYAVPMRRNFFDFVLFSFVSYTEEHEAAAVNRSRNLLDL